MDHVDGEVAAAVLLVVVAVSGGGGVAVEVEQVLDVADDGGQ
ncbi:hypothetical protein [Frankia gtarii]|nr:hypothetical protein [Frankia gtarii]